jgi:cyclic pyranopterin phosphate synthase
MKPWTQKQLDGRFTVAQISFMDFKKVPGGYEVRSSSGELIPPPATKQAWTVRKALIYGSKRLLPNRLRMRLILWYQAALNWWKYGERHFPHAVAIEISTFCNRTCSYCPNSTNPTPKNFMSMDVFEKCLDRLAEIDWSGPLDYNRYNEPTADKRLPDLVRRTVERLPKALPRIITNGDYLTPDYVQELIDAGVVNFSVTRHPPFSEKWDRKMWHLMELFPNHITYNGVIEGWSRLSNRGGAVELPTYNPISQCDAPSIAFQITMNGDVKLCCADYHKKHIYGNVCRSDLLTIWNNPEFRRVRDEVRSGVARLKICKECFGV